MSPTDERYIPLACQSILLRCFKTLSWQTAPSDVTKDTDEVMLFSPVLPYEGFLSTDSNKTHTSMVKSPDLSQDLHHSESSLQTAVSCKCISTARTGRTRSGGSAAAIGTLQESGLFGGRISKKAANKFRLKTGTE